MDNTDTNLPETKPSLFQIKWYLSLMVSELGQIIFLIVSLLSLGLLSVTNLIITYGIWKALKSRKMTILMGSLNGGDQDNAIMMRNIKSGAKFLILSILIVLSNNYFQ